MHVDEDDSLKWGLVDSRGRKQQAIFINESGLYSLILSSKLPQAKAFKRWVTSEVLPQIRMTGGYIPDQGCRRKHALGGGNRGVRSRHRGSRIHDIDSCLEFV